MHISVFCLYFILFSVHCDTVVGFLYFKICCNYQSKSFPSSFCFSFFFSFFCIYLNMLTQMTSISPKLYEVSPAFSCLQSCFESSSLIFFFVAKEMELCSNTSDTDNAWFLVIFFSSWYINLFMLLHFCFISITMSAWQPWSPLCLVTWYPNIRVIYNAHNSDYLYFLLLDLNFFSSFKLQ